MAGFLTEAVQSVVNNNYENTEIIIIDDGSTDASLHVAEQLAEKKQSENIRIIVKSIPHAGKSVAINAGLKIANGDFITFLDADDELPSHSIKLRAQRLNETNADITLGEFEVFSEGKITGRRRIPVYDSSALKKKLLYGWKTPFHLNAMLIKKGLVKKVGLYDEQLLRGQEKDYAIRLLNENPEIAFINESVYQYRKYRGLGNRISLRLQTFKYTTQLFKKHTSGLQRIFVLTWHCVLEILKLIFNIFASYKK